MNNNFLGIRGLYKTHMDELKPFNSKSVTYTYIGYTEHNSRGQPIVRRRRRRHAALLLVLLLAPKFKKLLTPLSGICKVQKGGNLRPLHVSSTMAAASA